MLRGSFFVKAMRKNFDKDQKLWSNETFSGKFALLRKIHKKFKKVYKFL